MTRRRYDFAGVATDRGSPPCGQETHAVTVEFSGTIVVPERCCPQITVSVME